MTEQRTLTVRIHNEGRKGLWAEVEELPGCFASGFNQQELDEALAEAIGQYLSTPEARCKVQLLESKPVEVTQRGHALRSRDEVRHERILLGSC
jgi:predicted RNase H-like HicB family nuclease